MYKSIKDYANKSYINEVREPINGISKQILDAIKDCGFTFEKYGKMQYPAAIVKRGRVEAIYVNCSKETKWYTIYICYNNKNGEGNFTVSFNKEGTVYGSDALKNLTTDLENTKKFINFINDLSKKSDLEFLPKFEL